MIYLLISVPFIISTAIFIFLYLKLNKKYKKIIEDVKELSNKKILRNGFFEFTMTIISKEDKIDGKPGEDYETIIYVKEIDRYTNGDSKIELEKIEVVNGYDNTQYEWVKKCTERRFSSIKETKDIEWLESETDLAKLRKLKLEQILKNNK